MSLSLSKCDFCKHYLYNEKKILMHCKAFPDGIPWVELSDDENDECANGIKFEEES